DARSASAVRADLHDRRRQHTRGARRGDPLGHRAHRGTGEIDRVETGVAMSDLKALINDLVAANRILSHEGIVDSMGHVSVRHPDNPKRYLLARARSPEMVEPADIMEFELDGTPVKDDG